MVHVVQGGPGALAFGPGKMTWILNWGDGSCGSGGPGGTWCSLILDLLFADSEAGKEGFSANERKAWRKIWCGFFFRCGCNGHGAFKVTW